MREHALLEIDPVTPLLGFGATGPQLSVAVAVPSAALICVDVGLQPKSALLATDPVAVMTGGVRSEVQVMVRDALAVLRQASVAVQLLLCERAQPLLVTAPVVPFVEPILCCCAS